MDDIEIRVRKLVVARLGVEGCDIRLDNDFRNDFDAESLKVVELVMVLEAELDVEIADNDAERIETVYQAIDCLGEAMPTWLPLDHRPMPWSFPAKRCASPPARAGGKMRDVPRFDYAGSSSLLRADPTFSCPPSWQRGGCRRLDFLNLPAPRRSTGQGRRAIRGARSPFVTKVAMAARRKTTPQEIDDIQDCMGSTRELDFDERRQARKVRIGDERSKAEVEAEFSLQWVREADHIGGQPDEDDGYQDNAGMDDLAPETLINEDGVHSPAEHDGKSPADRRLRVVYGGEIGAGHGLDEAKLVRRDPFDGSPTEEC